MTRVLVLVMAAVLAAGCAAGRAYGRGDRAARVGDWDTAVEHYRRAVQAEPRRADFRIALERALLSASLMHLDRARVLEVRGQFDEALREYRRANEFDPGNRQVAGKVQELERTIRQQIEAAQPTPTITQMRERARQATAEPLLNPASREPLDIRFNNASVRDILNFIGNATGINVIYDRDYADRPYTVQLAGLTLEEALNQVLSSNQLFYKVVNDRTIMVVPDTPQKRGQYEEQVVRTFYISHADPAELGQMLTSIIRLPSAAVPPAFFANKTSNTITVRAGANVMAIVEKMIEANDNPRAEVVIDVQILEVNKGRAQQFGLDLGSYTIGGAFSPERDPRGTGDAAGTLTPEPFNLNSVTRGVNLSDFYLTVPSAVVRFLETDSETRVVAKPQLRGAEGQKITLNLGEEIPIPSTLFTPFAQGGANVNPLTSFTYRPVGVIVEMTPRVTFEGEIILDLLVESSSLGRSINIAGQDLPSFGSRRVVTKLRLRDGESNLLAGLLQEQERRSLAGFPGILRLPVIKQLFSSNDNEVTQTDIIMLLTPRLVRTHELTQQDVSPIFIGTQNNLGLGGPPPLIAPIDPVPPGASPVIVPAVPAVGAPPGSGVVSVIPPGSSPTPGTTAVPVVPVPAAPAGTPPPEPSTGVPPPGVPPAVTTPPSAPPATPTSTTPLAVAQVILSPPSVDFRVGGGPYTVPISISNSSRVSTVSVTVTFNPSVLRVRTVQEGSFMRQGGVTAQFTQQVDAATGRLDIAIARTADGTGASGVGLLAAVLFDAVAPGPANLMITGLAAAPGGTQVPLQFLSPAVAVK